MLDDVRYGIRGFLKNPGFTAIALLTMALAIGATTVVFSVVDAILLRPLPGVADPGRLVAIERHEKSGVFDNLSYPDFLDFRDRNHSFSGVAAHSPAMLSAGGGTAERLRGDVITSDYFTVLGVKPAAGRLLDSRDDRAQVAVLSYGLWQRKFGGDSNAIGRRIQLNGQSFTIAGVAQEGFRGTAIDDSYDVWVPIAATPQMIPRLSAGILQDRAAGWIWIFGRLKPRVSVTQAQAEMEVIAGQLAAEHPVTNAGRTVTLATGLGMYPDDRADLSGLLGLLTGAAALLVSIACANVAGLFLIRASARARELALRMAVGAGRGRILRQLMAEGMLLAIAAGAVALLLAEWTLPALRLLGQTGLPLERVDFSLDGTVFAFTLAVCAISGIVFAFAPAAQASNLDLASALKTGSAGAGSKRTHRRAALVAGQVTLSFVLMSASGMLLRDLYRIVTADPGFDTGNVAMISIDASTLGYSREHVTSLAREILERARHAPGIISASLAFTVPPDDFSSRDSIFYPGQEPSPEEFHGHSMDLGLRVDIDSVAPGYFQTLGIPLLAGRDFTGRDPQGVIVSRKLAERMWPGENAVGKRLAWPDWGGPRRPPFEVIGVAADAKYRSLIADAPLLMYVPMLDRFGGRARIVARTASGPAGAIAELQDVVHQAGQDVPAYHPETMREHIAESLWQQRMAAIWIGAFSLLALILAALGLYGAIAQSVAQRTREMGIRIALGARPGSVARLILREGMAVAVLGLALGIPAAFGFGALTRRFLAGARGEDSAILGAIAAVLATVMLAACWIPARRAARVDPIRALRQE